ncbi:MAG TPA: hypothetical protein VKF42_09685, partial [Chitinivibrionales bacterium]|nr:hypothetical protein [Chitinivibrionales bacterium]
FEAQIFPVIALVGLACVSTLPPRVCIPGEGGIIDVCGPDPSDSTFRTSLNWSNYWVNAIKTLRYSNYP